MLSATFAVKSNIQQLSYIVVLVLSVFLNPVSGDDVASLKDGEQPNITTKHNSAEKIVAQLRKRYKLPPIDAVRLHLWSRFGTVERFADELNVPQQELKQFLQQHRWELMDAPALSLQNKKLEGRKTLTSSSKEKLTVTEFVSQTGKPANQQADASVSCDHGYIKVSVTCDEPELKKINAKFPVVDPLSKEERWFWNGDYVPLKKTLFKNYRQEMDRWSEVYNTPPEQSVLLDDCVIIFLTPVAIGKDRSHLFPLHAVPKPVQWLKETGNVNNRSRIYLEGCYYAIAINPNGAVLDLFYDPWDSGTVCSAWSSRSTINRQQTDGSWKIDIQIPWRSLQPKVNENSVWGVDLARIRRCGAGEGVVSRSSQSSLLQYNLPTPVPAERKPIVRQKMNLQVLSPKQMVDEFPTDQQWEAIKPVGELAVGSRNKEGNKVNAHITYDKKQLYIRFDCQEPNMARLKVVTADEELAEYKLDIRKRNYLDRREQFGMDWGDYVEVVLTPNLDFTDSFHGGVFNFLVNSRGDILERYYDSYGMFNVLPHPEWKSGTKVRVYKLKNSWSVELAIPFDTLCTKRKVSTKWGLNLHRCLSDRVTGDREQHLFWSPIGADFQSGGWRASLRDLRNPSRLGIITLDPTQVSLSNTAKIPTTALARSEAAKNTKPAQRVRESDRLASVHFVDDKLGWATGGQGTILHTKDGGASWNLQKSHTDFILEKIYFANKNHGWVVGGWPRDAAVALHGGMGVILATTDGGKNWSKQLDGAATWLKDVFFINQKMGWVVGEYGTVLKTTDGGKHWRHIENVPTATWLHGITFLNSQRGFAVGYEETLLKTEDGGETWNICSTPVPHRANGWPTGYRSVAFANNLQGWIAGDGGTILGTTDGGKTWALEKIELSAAARELAAFENVKISSDGTAWGICPVGLFRKTPTDDRFRLLPTAQPGWYRDACFPTSSRGWLVGERNLILQTANSGDDWREQRHSSREMGLMYATAHDHHLNNGPIGILSDQYDTAYICCGRGIRSFELRGDYNRNMVAASAMAVGVSVVHSFEEFQWGSRDRPHNIAQRYQNYGGIDGVEKRLVAMIRTIRPRILIAEQPIIQEGYYAHGVGEITRAQILAFDSAADPRKFPELLELRLKPYAPKKLYLYGNWATKLHHIHPTTLRLGGSMVDYSKRLGMTHSEAKARSRYCFLGLLDRARPPREKAYIGGTSFWGLHLKKEAD